MSPLPSRAGHARRAGRMRTVILLDLASAGLVAGVLVAGGRTVSGWLPYWAMPASLADYGLRAITLWYLGSEAPAAW